MESWIHDYVQTLSPAELQIHLILLCIFMGFLLYKSYQTYQRLRYISDTATSKIGSAAQGFVELKGLGELIPGPVISSPMSQQRCLWFQCIVECRKTNGKHTVWVEESNLISDHIFELQDESGSCIVIPDGAHVIPSKSRVWYGSHINAQYNGLSDRFSFGRFIGVGRYRFTEKLIMVADPLYVIGTFKSIRKTIHAEILKTKVEQLVQTWKNNPTRYLTDFDADKNGKISGDEWKRVRLSAQREVLKRDQPSVHHTIYKPEESNHPFVISAIPEQDILWKIKKYMGINLILFISMLYILLTALNASH